MNTKARGLYKAFMRNIHQVDKTNHIRNWNEMMSAAKKIVSNSTSPSNLQGLLNDGTVNIQEHLRNLAATKHPCLGSFNGILNQKKNYKPDWGLIILLVSKTNGQHVDVPDIDLDGTYGILHSQRYLAEITEMVRMSHLIHKSMVNSTEKKPELRYGNKIALLSGDLLYSKTCTLMANLRNQEVTELMGTALRDLTESEFVGLRDLENLPLPAKPSNKKVEFDVFNQSNLDPFPVEEALGSAEAEWTGRNVLSSASLLGKGCEGALRMARHPLDKQEKAFRFGVHFALACQAHEELTCFVGDYSGPFNLVSAPLLFELENNPNLYDEIEIGKDDVSVVNYKLLYETIVRGSGIESTRNLQEKHSQFALNLLDNFSNNEARSALSNMISAMLCSNCKEDFNREIFS